MSRGDDLADMAAKVASLPILGWVRRFIMLALVGLAAWLTVRVVLALIAPSSVWTPVETAVAPSAPMPAATAVSYNFTTNPFAAGDEATEPDDAPLAADSDVPETTLNLTITGIRAEVGDPEGGSVQIRAADGTEKRYYVRDVIQSNVELRGVLSDHILLIVNGENQRLSVEDARGTNASGPMTAPSGASQSQLSTIQGLSFDSFMRAIETRSVVDTDPSKRGLRVSARSPSVDLSVYGVQEGDLIQSVAGVPTTNGLPNFADIQRRVSTGRPVTVEFLRDSQPMTVTIGGPS